MTEPSHSPQPTTGLAPGRGCAQRRARDTVFDLKFIDHRKKLARIRIGAFEEEFGVSMRSTTTALEGKWRRQLATLLGRTKKVALPVWGRGRIISRAWLFYRVGDAVFVRDRVFFRGLDPKRNAIPKREIESVEDRRVAEWSIEIGAICDFLTEPDKTRQPTTG